VAILVGWLPLVVALPAGADVSTVTAGDRAEAWYGGAPVANCTSPVGCPPVSPPSAYPANTLHVGQVGGSESARTYIALDLLSLPPGSVALSATLTLPLSADPSAGNVDASSATPVLCLAAAAFDDGASGPGNPPGVDCSVHAIATYKPASGPGSSDAFTADLSQFLTAWQQGTTDFGIAILPAPGESANSAWHLAFNGRQLAGAAHISAIITVSANFTTEAGFLPTLTSTLPGNPPTQPVLPQPVTAGAPPGAIPPVVAAAAPAARTVTNVALPLRLSPVPWPFLWFPLLLAMGATYAIRTFTRPLLDGRPHGDG
jgi:hypothetical protein